MAVQKKHGKGRLDKWYKLAKEKGYRARAAFKLIQLNKKYGFLENSKVLLDLCAAPGSWCQVAVETMPVNSIIVGVDLSPIKPIPKVITFQSDITTEKCRATIRQHLKTWKADTVLHDGAPNVGTAWVQDSFNQAELALQAMKLATDFLVEGGTFVTKVFRSKDYNSLLWVFNQLFEKVEATKPPSSRNVSAEIFVVCRGFKAPKRIDPRFLDPKSVFAELADPTPNNEARVYNPEIKKRKRDGYEEGDHTQYKELPATDFIQTTDPIAILGQYNRLTFSQPKNGDVALAALDKMPETTSDVRLYCEDLRVLSRKEFKTLLRWRLRVRELFGFPTKKSVAAAAAEAEKAAAAEEVAKVDTMDEEMKIQRELEELKDRFSAKKKRERRKENERRQKEVVRMQLHMTAPMEIAMDQGDTMGDAAMFALKKLDQTEALRRIARGKMATLTPKDRDDAMSAAGVVLPSREKKKAAVVAAADKAADRDSGIGSSPDEEEEDSNEEDEEDDENDDEEDRLERELDGLYDQYQERKAEADSKYRARKARRQNEDDEWEGFSGEEGKAGDDNADDSEEELEEDESSDDDDDDKVAASKITKPLLTDLDNTPADASGLSKRARSFFNQDIFKDVAGILGEVEDEDEDEEGAERKKPVERAPKKDKSAKETNAKEKAKSKAKAADESQDDSDDGGFEVVKSRKDDENDWEEERRRPDGKLDIDIITAEAMTLAHELATGKTSRQDMVDDGFNKRAFRDRDGLPEWFVDDEMRHDKVQRPMTKAAAEAIKEKTRALNARPIKKVREARARKKFKAAQRMEKLKKKSELLIADEGMTEKEKSDTISKMLSKAAKKKPHTPTKVVVARGANRGIQGRPKGVKGRYKLVDARMKKETRALKRVAKRFKK